MLEYYTTPAPILKLFKIAFLLILLLAFLSPFIWVNNKVKADPFYPTYDSANCQFSNTNGVQYRNPGQNVEYDQSQLVGVSGNWIETHRFSDIANPYYPDARRYDNIADKVAVPPNTNVDIGMWVWNYAGHDVYVENADIFLSSQDRQSDLAKLGVQNVGLSQSCWKLGGSTVCRSGRMLRVPVKTNYSYRGNDLGKILYSFQTIQPIQIKSTTATPIWEGINLKIRYDVKVANVSDYSMCSIELKHLLPNGQMFSRTACIYAHTEHTYTYFADMSSNYPSTISHNPVKVYDPNRHTEIVSSPVTSNRAPEERSIVIWRDDKDHSSPTGLYGAQPGWGNGNGLFAVELIPYTTSANIPTTNISPDLRIEKLVSDSDENKVKSVNSNINEEIKYNIKLSNLGGRVENIIVSDYFDFNTQELVEAKNAKVENGKILWNEQQLGKDEFVEFEIKAKIKKLSDGNHLINNKAEYISGSLSGNSTTNININANTELTIEKYVRNITAEKEDRYLFEESNYGFKDVKYIFGDTLLYTIVIKNTGNTIFTPRYIDKVDKSQYVNIKYTFNPILKDLYPQEEYIYQYELETSYINSPELIPFNLTSENIEIVNIVEIIPDTNKDISLTSQSKAVFKLPLVTFEKTVLEEQYLITDKPKYKVKITNNSDILLLFKLSDYANNLKMNIDPTFLNWYSLKAGESIFIEYSAEIFGELVNDEVITNTATLSIKDLNGNEYENIQRQASFRVIVPKGEVLGLATTGDDISLPLISSPLILISSLLLLKKVKKMKDKKEVIKFKSL